MILRLRRVFAQLAGSVVVVVGWLGGFFIRSLSSAVVVAVLVFRHQHSFLQPLDFGYQLKYWGAVGEVYMPEEEGTALGPLCGLPNSVVLEFYYVREKKLLLLPLDNCGPRVASGGRLRHVLPRDGGPGSTAARTFFLAHTITSLLRVGHASGRSIPPCRV